MWRKHLGLALVLAAIIASLPSTAGAWGSRVVVVAPSRGGSVFFVPGHRFVHHPRVFVVQPLFIAAPFVPPPVIAVRPVWAPGFWSWNGMQWVRIAGRRR